MVTNISNPGGTPRWVRDATANDSDKVVITVPTGKKYLLLMVRARIAATATAGTRLVNCRILGDGTNVNYISPNVAATANQSAVLLLVTPGVYSNTNILTNDVGDGVNASTLFHLPYPCYLSAGAMVRVIDYAAIDAAADDLTVDVYYIEYDV